VTVDGSDPVKLDLTFKSPGGKLKAGVIYPVSNDLFQTLEGPSLSFRYNQFQGYVDGVFKVNAFSEDDSVSIDFIAVNCEANVVCGTIRHRTSEGYCSDTAEWEKGHSIFYIRTPK
jgi:hypothetical protein